MNRRHNQLQKISNSEDQENTLQNQFKDEIIKLIDFYKEKTKEINQIDLESRNQDIGSGQILKYINTVQQILSVVATKMNEFHFQSKQYKTQSKLNSTKYLKLLIQIEQSFNDLQKNRNLQNQQNKQTIFAQIIQNSSDTTNKQYFKQAFTLTQEYHKCFIQANQSQNENVNTQQINFLLNQLSLINQKFKDLINQINIQQKDELINNKVKDEIQQQKESEKEQLFRQLQQLGDQNQALYLVLQDFQKMHSELLGQLKSVKDTLDLFKQSERKAIDFYNNLQGQNVQIQINSASLLSLMQQEAQLQQALCTLDKFKKLIDQIQVKHLDKRLISDVSLHLQTVRNPAQIKKINAPH